MIRYVDLFYDGSFISNSYNQLFDQVKNLFKYNKIIYEKIPASIENRKMVIDRNRLITESHDRLLIFSLAETQDVSVLWYKYYNKYKHIDIYNGKAVVFNSPISIHDIEIKQNSNSLFSSVFCDFKYYNITKFINQHQNSFNLTCNFIIK